MIVEQPTLTIVTRHWVERPYSFERLMASLSMQVDQRFQHVVLVDEKGVGVVGANKMMVSAIGLSKGKFVMVVDDDDELASPKTTQTLNRVIGAIKDVDMIFFRVMYGADTVLPEDSYWERRPERTHIGGQCAAVRLEIFEKNVHLHGEPAFPSDYGWSGDYSYLNGCWNDSRYTWWVDEVLVRQQRYGGGKSDRQNGVKALEKEGVPPDF